MNQIPPGHSIEDCKGIVPNNQGNIKVVDWVWLMIRIAEKVGFLKTERSQSVQKQILAERWAQKDRAFLRICDKDPPQSKSLTVQGGFCKIVDVGRAKLCFRRPNGKCQISVGCKKR